MTDSTLFILVHGAWHGAWCWDLTRTILETHGHRVIAPTLAGLGERKAERHPGLSLADHIDSIAELVTSQAGPIVLVGHSYGGVVVEGVCDRAKERIAHALFLDSPRPRHGQPALANISRHELAERFGPLVDGYMAPPPPPERFGIAPDHPLRTWFMHQLTDHPVFTFVEPLDLPRRGSAGMSRTYIRCSRTDAVPETDLELLEDGSWSYRQIRSGHDVMLLEPALTASILMAAAQHPQSG